MTRRDFTTPSTLPESNITRCITIPASQAWLGLVNAALLMLTEEWRYTQVLDTDMTPAETAAVAFDMYVAYLAGCEVDMECSDIIACMLPYMQAQQIAGGVVRLDPVTDEPQVSYDGGVTWTAVPQSTQPVQIPTPTPTPGSDDAERICLAATRAALIIAEFYSQTFGAFTADLLNTLNGINQFLHSINTALYNLIYSPYEGILEAAGWFDFDFTTNYTAATLTTEQIELITCLLIDQATVDGSGIVAFNHAAVQAALISVLGVNPGTAVTLNVSNMRSEGLQAASQVNIVSSADCSFCDDPVCDYEGATEQAFYWNRGLGIVPAMTIVTGTLNATNVNACGGIRWDEWLGDATLQINFAEPTCVKSIRVSSLATGRYIKALVGSTEYGAQPVAGCASSATLLIEHPEPVSSMQFRVENAVGAWGTGTSYIVASVIEVMGAV